MPSLRKARIEDHRRRGYKRGYAFKISDIAFNGYEYVSDLNFCINKGISAIVGRNGIGKSNLVRVLYNSFYSNSSNRPIFKTPLFDKSETSLTYTIDNNPVNILLGVGESINKDADNPIITSYMYDPCTFIPSLQSNLLAQKNFEEILEGFEEIKFDDEKVQIINHLTHGRYLEISQINIEDTFDNIGTVPFFKVKTDLLEYDSRGMGLGEMSLFYFFWLIDYLSDGQTNDILIVEEPESFLPPVTQERLMNILACFAGDNSVPVLISTHSEHILKDIPKENIQILQRIQDKLQIDESTNQFDYMRHLGLVTPKRGIILFEDAMAGMFIKALLKNNFEYSPDCFYYKQSGSDSDIIADLNQYIPNMDGFKTVAIFDGDCRSNNGLKIPAGTNVCYLPTDSAPEVVLIEFIKINDPERLSNIFRESTENIALALENARGADHHDYFHEFARTLNIELNTVVNLILTEWIFDENHQEMLNEFYTDVSVIMDA